MSHDPDEDDDRLPLGVRIAGWIWLASGAMMVVVGVLVGMAALQGFRDPVPLACSLFAVGFSLAFIKAGVEIVRGTAGSRRPWVLISKSEDLVTLGGASILLALVELGLALLLVVVLGPNRLLPADFVAGLLLAQGILLLTAGVLAIAGRNVLPRWSEENRPSPVPQETSTAEDASNPTRETGQAP
jgi:hypothetical protein